IGSWKSSPPYLATAGTAGDRLTFTARFTDLVVRLARTPTSGRLAVFVDGTHTTTLDLFEPESSWVVGVPVVSNAPDRLHTVELLALGEADPAARGTEIHVEELVVKGPIAPGRPFAAPAPINRGNPFSPFMETLLQACPPGTPILEIGGGDRGLGRGGRLNLQHPAFDLADGAGDLHPPPLPRRGVELLLSQARVPHLGDPVLPRRA